MPHHGFISNPANFVLLVYACSYVHAVRAQWAHCYLTNYRQCCISYSFGLNLYRIDLTGGYLKWLTWL